MSFIILFFITSIIENEIIKYLNRLDKIKTLSALKMNTNFISTQIKERMLSIKGVSFFIKKNFKNMFYTLLNINRKFFSDKGVARKILTLFKKMFQPTNFII